MGSGSLERVFASLVPSNMSMRASMTKDTATLVCLNMTTPPLGRRNAYRSDWICAEYGPESGRKCRVRRLPLGVCTLNTSRYPQTYPPELPVWKTRYNRIKHLRQRLNRANIF